MSTKTSIIKNYDLICFQCEFRIIGLAMSKHVTGNLSIRVHAYVSANRFGSLKELINLIHYSSVI